MTSDAGSFNDTTSQAGTRTAPARAYHRKWESSFAAAEDEENAKKPGTVRTTMSERMKRGWKLQSIPGFFFGPLYYLYLRMWRKGLLIIALLPIIALVQTAIGGGKFLNFLIPVLCMTYVKRDYYRFCTRGETVWPWVRFSKNLWTDAALVTVVMLSCCTGLAVIDKKSESTSERTQTAQPVASSAQAQETSVEDGNLPDLADWQLKDIESKGGMSGIDCSIARQLMPNIYYMRSHNSPLDVAKDYIYNKSSGERSNAFMWETVEETYKDPVKMQKLIRTGLWSKACVTYIRGY